MSADDVRAVRAARALRKPNPTPADEALYHGQGFGVGNGFDAAMRLLSEAVELVEEYAQYVSPFLLQKWGHADDLTRLKSALIDGSADA